MKSMMKQLQSALIGFIDNQPPKKAKASPVNLKANQIITTIKEAQAKESPIHVIYRAKSFTGHIKKYDQLTGQLVLKNIKQNLTAIISLADIDKASLVPHTRTSTKEKP
ncbi:Uncharacterised protein [Streptococcus equi subsp. equi]|uniref:YolD-like protein n=1 Tax=Streptococcus equi subsp. equi TaxID=148942 RepID=A0A380JQZ3_9STRE|nr:hypothetical protein [Streptococcus equi]SUN47183.1 Uncharacterised protein [Streptococcus equi subsp. equi]